MKYLGVVFLVVIGVGMYALLSEKRPDVSTNSTDDDVPLQPETSSELSGGEPADQDPAPPSEADPGGWEKLSSSGLVLDVRADAKPVDPGAVTVLFREPAGEPFALFRENELTGKRPPEDGNLALVHVRGYEPVEVSVTPGPRVKAALEVEAGICRLIAPDLEGTPKEPQLLVRVFYPGPTYNQHLLLDRYKLLLTPTGTDIRAPGAGLLTEVQVLWMHKSLVWPMSVRARAGEVVRFEGEKVRRFTIIARGGGPVSGAWGYAYPALDKVVTEGTRGDALLSWMVHNDARPTEQAGGSSIELLSSIPYHLYVQVGRARSYRYLPPGQEGDSITIDLRPRDVLPVPLIAGRPLPKGSLVVPGRLDLNSLQVFIERTAIRKRFAALVENGDAVELIRAATYTAWVPDQGVAYLRPGPEGRLRADAFEPGEIMLSFGDGVPAHGTIDVSLVLSGEGRLQVSRASDQLYRFSPRRELTMPGLPYGRYSLGIRFARKNEGPWSMRRIVHLTPENPKAELDISE